jgi:hypothetical protein
MIQTRREPQLSVGKKRRVQAWTAKMLSTVTTLLVSFRRKETEGQEKKLHRKILPAVASLLVLGTLLSIVVPAFAEMPVLAIGGPTLVVRTVAEDDQIRNTGVIILGMEPSGFPDQFLPFTDWLAQFKISITYNGIAVNATTLYCQVIEKDKYNPMKDQQFPAENLKTVPKDQSGLFVCKWRPGKPGIGVLDVYYVGTAAAEYIADYVLVVGATYTVGRSVVYGTDMQDICVLGYPIMLTIADGALFSFDPLGSYVSCEDAALAEKDALGLGIPWS